MRPDDEIKIEIARLEAAAAKEKKYLDDPYHYTSAGGVDSSVYAAQDRLDAARAKLRALRWVLKGEPSHGGLTTCDMD